MAIHVQIDPLERTATLRGVHSLCAGESSEVVLSGVPDADTPTLSLRVYRDATEAVQVACSVRPGTDPAEEGLVPVEGRAALRRGTLDLRTSAVSEWASEDAAAAAAADEARRSGSKEPEARAAASYRRPDSAWLVVADSTRVWAACAVPFVLRPFDDALSPDPEVPLPSYAERAEAAAGAAESAAQRAERAAEDAESAEAVGKVGRDELFDDPDSASPKVKASLLPSYVDDVLEVAELPQSGESGKLYVVTGTNAVYRWSGSGFVEVSPSRDWSGELAAKRDMTDLSVYRDRWLLVKPDGSLAWLGRSDPQRYEWTGDGFTLVYETAEAYWGLANVDAGGWVVDDSDDSPPDANKLRFLGSDDASSVYRLVRGSRLALDTEVAPKEDRSNKTASLSAQSTDAQYPSAKAVFDALAGKRGLSDRSFDRPVTGSYRWILATPDGTVELLPSQEGLWTSGGSDGDYALQHVAGQAYWTLLKKLVSGSPARVAVFDGGDGAETLGPASGYSAARAQLTVPDSLALLADIPSVESAAQGGTAPSLVTTGEKHVWNGKYEKPSGGIPASDLAQAVQTALSEIPGKANAADLRYRIAEAELTAKLPTGVTVWLESEEVTNYAIVSDVVADRWELKVADHTVCIWDLDGMNGDPYGAEFKDGGGAALSTPPDLIIFRALSDRTVNLITASDETSIDIELPAAVTVDGVRYCRDFFLDVDNSANASDLALEFTGLDVSYAFVLLEDDSISEMMTIGAGERVRLYFTETPYITSTVPVINVARVTLGDFVTSTTPATQGGNR